MSEPIDSFCMKMHHRKIRENQCLENREKTGDIKVEQQLKV